MITSRIFLPSLLGIALAAAPAGPVFDVASVKPTAPGAREGLAIQPRGRLSANGFSLRTLIVMANHLAIFQISGADGWMADDRWSIEAKAEEVAGIPAWSPPYPPEVIAVRLRSLLEDRFFLKVHREKRKMTAYTLKLGKNGGKLNLMDQSARGGMKAGPGVIQASAVTMDQFVTYLNRIMDLPVIDQTSLGGRYNFELTFAPESSHPLSAPALPDGSMPAPSVNNNPSIFDAIHDQLGLELKSAKEPVEVLVIDSAARPSAN
jgi:uncharacterized protein (TIGR03435 family)